MTMTMTITMNWLTHWMLSQLEDLHEGLPLLPPGDAKLRAHCRLWADHVRRTPSPPPVLRRE
jgi:hypothetical protein